MKYNTNDNIIKLQMGKSIPNKRTQKIFDNVTSKILQNDSAKNRNISSTTGIRYEQPLKDIHPELDLALAYAQPGNMVAKAFAPSMAKGFVEGLKEGDLQQAIISGLVPESKVTSIVKSVKKPISEAERLGIPKGERSNPKALEDPQYWGYQQWNSRYNAAVNSGNIQEAQRLRDLHFKIKSPNAPQYNFYHGTFNKERPFYIFEPQSNNELFFHFSPYKDTAEKFMGIAKTRNENGRLITAKLNIQRPTTVTDPGWWNWYRIPEANPRISKKLGMDGSTAGQYYSDLLLKEPSVSEANGKMMDMIDADAFMYKNYTEDTGRISIAVPRPTQIKLSDPITRTKNEEIIPIVKRDNFRNPDMRFKQGGILKGQNGGSIKTILKMAGDKNVYPTSTTSAFLKGATDYILRRKEPKSFIKSKYRPTVGDNGESYYTRNGLKNEVALTLFGGTDYGSKFLGNNVFYKDFDDAYNSIASRASNRDMRHASNGTLGQYSITTGSDDRGRYLSFSDKFDFVTIPGNPIHIYDRIYEDEVDGLYNNNDSAFNLGDVISRAPFFKQVKKHKHGRSYKQGEIIKGRSGLEKVPIKNDKPKELIPVKGSRPPYPSVLPKESFIDKLRKRWAEMRNETKRPNAFGKFVITREGTKVVDDGGKLA